MIACEDTRRCRLLLRSIGPRLAGTRSPRLLALHDHNEAQATATVLAAIAAGQDVALVSDAGTPLMSDPGYELVRAAWAAGIPPVPIPGPSAIVTALSVSPIPVNEFRFAGFLPAKVGPRRTRLAQLIGDGTTVVFFETARRLVTTLEMLQSLGAGETRIFVARELTKLHETLYSGTVNELAEFFVESVERKGELVCVLARSDAPGHGSDVDATLAALLEELAPATAARLAAKITGVSRSLLYDRALVLARRRE